MTANKLTTCTIGFCMISMLYYTLSNFDVTVGPLVFDIRRPTFGPLVT